MTISHIMVGTNDITKARRFYDATFAALDVQPAASADAGDRLVYRLPNGIFAVTKPINGAPAQAANGGTVGFVGNSPEQVAAWHDAGIASGGTSAESPPGVRERDAAKFYSAYLRDPDGNKLCAIYRMAEGN